MFKIIMGDDIQDAYTNTEDFILKNVMFGIFLYDTLAGFVVVQHTRFFMIDSEDSLVETFYIQEILVHPDFRGQGLGKHLFDYCISRCPQNKMYVFDDNAK